VGALGGGGSVLAVPVLVYLLDQPVPEATTASLFVVAAGALAGATGHARAGRVCWRHAASFTAAAVPGVVAGTLIGDAIGSESLLLVLAGIMLLAARATWRRGDQDDADGGWEGRTACPPLRLPQDLAAGAGVGLVTGLVGVGGGFLIVPTLAVALSFTMRTAIGTSLVIISATAVLGAAVHLLAGRAVEVDVAATMALACAVGAVGGAAVTGRVDQRTLAHGFATLVVAVALYLVLSVSLLDGPPAG
jgi:uncharacterized membrane protein YfcA